MGLPENCGLELYSRFQKGQKNLISDVPGVVVGHVTRREGDVNTGVTAILPHGGNLFHEKVMAGVEVLNGFGKSMGLIQVKELGTIETPIIMTNTLSVGTAFTGLCRYMLEQNPEIGVTTGTVNCLVTECNDGYLNDIRGLHVREEDIPQAIRNASPDFEEGAVGSGTGMSCLGLKGGIGSASRKLEIEGETYHIGALVMTNFGAPGHLVIGGVHYDTRTVKKKDIKRLVKQRMASISFEEEKKAEREAEKEAEKMDRFSESAKSQGENRKEILEEGIVQEQDKGSIIMIIGTDIPLSERQLTRVAKRSAIALGRCGSYMGNGSGDIAISFTTANRIPHEPEQSILTMKMFSDDEISKVFEASVEAVEESIISSLWHAESFIGRAGHGRMGLQDYLKNLKDL
ncbi:MAG: P1 family peptidase [Eubacteriales bacterium]|nr:P1 family peptidase [Eubacteriales bacterium]